MDEVVNQDREAILNEESVVLLPQPSEVTASLESMSSIQVEVTSLAASLDNAFTVFSWVLGLSIGIFTIVVGLGSFLSFVVFRQNANLRKLHSEYEEKLHQLNTKRLEVTERANDISNLERRNIFISNLLLGQSAITRAYMLVQKLDFVIKEHNLRKENEPRQDAQESHHHALEIIDDVIRYTYQASRNVHDLRSALDTPGISEDLKCEVFSLSARVGIAFGLAYKRKYMVSGFKKNLEQAILHLKDIEKDISLLGEKGAEARYRYNLACYQSLGGHFDSAELNLEKAIELNDRYGIQLRTDEDLVPLLAARPAAFEATNVDTSPGK